MKATIELPDDLFRAVKVRAARDGRRLKDVMAEVVRRGLDEPAPAYRMAPPRVRLPLVQCAHPAQPGQEVTPERAADILLEAEAAAGTAEAAAAEGRDGPLR